MRHSDVYRNCAALEGGEEESSCSAPESSRETERLMLESNYTRASGLSSSRGAGSACQAGLFQHFADFAGQRAQGEGLLQEITSEVGHTLSLDRFIRISGNKQNFQVWVER